MKQLVTMLAAIYAAGISIPSLAADTSTTVPQMKGMVISSQDETLTGLWTLPVTATGTWQMDIAMDPGYASFYNGVMYGDVYYATRCNAQYGTIVYVDAYSMTDGTKLWTNYPKLTALPYDLTLNPYDDKIYGFFSNEKNTGMVLATISYDKAGETVTPIREMEGNWIAIAADPSGQLYGISSDLDIQGTSVKVNSSSLHKIDRLTGETTLVGETGQLPLITGSATIDARSGRMFWTVGPDASQSYLCEVDLTTGKATKLMDFAAGRQVVGLYVPTPPAEDDAPAAVTDAEAIFDEGSLNGYVSFTAPASLYDGTAASGEISYTILCNGSEAASGTTSFGAATKAEVTVAERGKYTFTISVANDKGSSPKVTVDKFVGFGTPTAPEGVTAENTDGTITVAWKPVSESADGGYIDAAAVTYTVTRIPGDVVIARNISATSVTDTPDAAAGMQAYSYTVTADNHSCLSAASESNKVVCGNPVLPWSEDFASAESIGFFTVVDANGDGKTWEYASGLVRVKYGTVTMDDWLISPPLRLEAGKMYRTTFKARSSNARYPEKIEAKWGAGATPADMTSTLVEPVTLSGDYETFGDLISPVTSGIYHIGLHGISDADMYNLEVCMISVEAGINAGAPSRPTELAVTADANGDYKATVSMKAPATDMSGAALSAIDRIELSRGETLVHTFTAPAPGAILTYDDILEQGGDYTYRAVAYKGEDAGPEASLTAFVGTPLAAAPASVAISEASDGEITLSWDEVSLSADGNAINPARVRYNIYDANAYGEPVAENVSGTSFTFTGVEAGTQKFVQYSVSAVTDRGESDRTMTKSIPAGTPYKEFHESYAGGRASTVYMTERINYGNWAPQADDSDVTSQDGDGGLMTMNGYFAGYCGAMTTGKISLADMKAPILRFYSYTPDNDLLDLNPLAVAVSADGGEWIEIFNKTVVEIGPTRGWHEVIVSLAEYAGRNISLKFTATTHDRPYIATYIDNINVESMAGIDLEVKAISAPAHVRGGEKFRIAVDIANNGAENAADYIVEIYADGNLLDIVDGDPIPSLGSGSVEFTTTMSPLSDKAVAFKAIVSHTDDTTNDNDASETLTVTPLVSPLPAPAFLTATQSADGSVALSWTAPEIAAAPASPVTDDFESTEAWSHYADGWAMRDLDGAAVCGFAQADLPGIEAGKTLASFFMFSATGMFEGNKYLMPNSGKQYLAAFARYDNGTTDDWAISPELSGEAQTVSFYIRSYDAAYPERVEVLYSTGSLEPADFIPTGVSVDKVPGSWTQCQADLPQGARNFAIRSCATNSFMLMLDDVTFTPLSSYGMEVTGYNVYRDGRLVNDTPVTATSFTDNVDNPDSHLWTVTALYGERESKGSDPVTAGTSSIDSPSADGIAIRAEAGRIVITGCEGLPVMVSAADGRVIYNGLGKALTEITTGAGVYVVKASSKVAKLIVR